MPSEDTRSRIAVVLTRSRVSLPLFGQYVGSETVIAKKYKENWLYVLKGEISMTFSEFEVTINALDTHLKGSESHESLFVPVLPSTNDKILIGIPRSPLLEEIYDESTGELNAQVETWQMKSTVPPRKRAVSDDSLLIPGLKRLSKQLRVDFAINVHGSEGKRKRQPTRSIYEEAVAVKRGKQAKTAKPKQQIHKKKKTKQIDSPEISEIDESEFTNTKPGNTDGALTKIVESISSAHEAALAAKNEIIKTMAENHAAAIAAKDELINAQAALIASTILQADGRGIPTVRQPHS